MKYLFKNCPSLESVEIGDSVKEICYVAFSGCPALSDIYYKGTFAQWLSIDKDWRWDEDSKNYTVHYTDGNIEKK